MCERFAPSFPVSVILGHSGFGDYFGHVEDAASDNIQEIIFLSISLMWNDAAVYGGRMELNFFVR